MGTTCCRQNQERNSLKKKMPQRTYEAIPRRQKSSRSNTGATPQQTQELETEEVKSGPIQYQPMESPYSKVESSKDQEKISELEKQLEDAKKENEQLQEAMAKQQAQTDEVRLKEMQIKILNDMSNKDSLLDDTPVIKKSKPQSVQDSKPVCFNQDLVRRKINSMDHLQSLLEYDSQQAGLHLKPESCVHQHERHHEILTLEQRLASQLYENQNLKDQIVSEQKSNQNRLAMLEENFNDQVQMKIEQELAKKEMEMNAMREAFMRELEKQREETKAQVDINLELQQMLEKQKMTKEREMEEIKEKFHLANDGVDNLKEMEARVHAQELRLKQEQLENMHLKQIVQNQNRNKLSSMSKFKLYNQVQYTVEETREAKGLQDQPNKIDGTPKQQQKSVEFTSYSTVHQFPSFSHFVNLDGSGNNYEPESFSKKRSSTVKITKKRQELRKQLDEAVDVDILFGTDVNEKKQTGELIKLLMIAGIDTKDSAVMVKIKEVLTQFDPNKPKRREEKKQEKTKRNRYDEPKEDDWEVPLKQQVKGALQKKIQDMMHIDRNKSIKEKVDTLLRSDTKDEQLLRENMVLPLAQQLQLQAQKLKAPRKLPDKQLSSPDLHKDSTPKSSTPETPGRKNRVDIMFAMAEKMRAAFLQPEDKSDASSANSEDLYSDSSDDN